MEFLLSHRQPAWSAADVLRLQVRQRARMGGWLSASTGVTASEGDRRLLQAKGRYMLFIVDLP